MESTPGLVRNDISDIEYYLSTQATGMNIHLANTVMAVVGTNWFSDGYGHMSVESRTVWTQQQDRIIAFIREMIPRIDFPKLREYYYSKGYKK